MKDKSFTIHDRNLQVLATEIYKVINNISPAITNSIFQIKKTLCNLRGGINLCTNNVKTIKYGTETLSFRGPKLLAEMPDYIKNSNSLLEFKSKIKKWKPIGCECKLCCTYIHNFGYVTLQ